MYKKYIYKVIKVSKRQIKKERERGKKEEEKESDVAVETFCNSY